MSYNQIYKYIRFAYSFFFYQPKIANIHLSFDYTFSINAKVSSSVYNLINPSMRSRPAQWKRTQKVAVMCLLGHSWGDSRGFAEISFFMPVHMTEPL